ncbi:MAG: flagellar biosynthesis protein FlhF [Thiobacillaceae bacterium]|jgi:flagellar biosynthesis protein FlhF|nr:flagellar biosynthesis protein FlhF [Thiobacillaceae bacterium]
MIKKFHASTTRDALRMVRDALGANAIILSNRQMNGGVEIIAVADLDVAALSSQAEPAAHVPVPEPAVPSRPAVTPLTEYIAQKEASLIRPARPAARPPDSPPRPVVPSPQEATGLPPATPAPRPDADMAAPPMQELTREVRLLRNLVEGQLAGFAWGEIAGRDPVRAEIMKRLLAAGFSTALSRHLLEKLPRELDLERAMKWLRAAIAHNLRTAEEGRDILDEGGVYALVGPTGVGKTTTVAKLAARAVLKHGAGKVALVTTDTYRIGAQDQLRIYGRILGTPVFAVQDENDLELTLSDLGRKHLVLIDTVGMNQRDKRVAEQVALLCGEQRGVKRLLLLGATAQGVTLEEVARAYSGAGLIGCILTKIDEALSYGPCLDVVIRHQLAVHYVTNGQRVPEDLHPASALYLVDRAFRLVQSESPYAPDEGDYPVLMAAMDKAHLPDEEQGTGMAGALR